VTATIGVPWRQQQSKYTVLEVLRAVRLAMAEGRWKREELDHYNPQYREGPLSNKVITITGAILLNRRDDPMLTFGECFKAVSEAVTGIRL
jgi:hypothetical protein